MKNLIYGLMSDPRIYLWIQHSLGADRLRKLCLDKFVQPKPGERILDLGCGPGYVLEYLPAVDYVGFDTEAKYIEFARKRYADRGAFHCEVFSERQAASLKPFDAILLFGLLHHLDDNEAGGLLGLIGGCLKPSGRVVTLDPCFTPDQSRISRFIGESDRGRFVRTAAAYDDLARPHFSDLSAEVVHNACRIPSTERIMRLGDPVCANI